VKIAIIYAYPPDALAGSKILQKIKETLQQRNIEYVLFDLYAQNFNPVLSKEEHRQYGSYISYDIAKIQAELKKAQIFVFVYPVWWSGPPAILKGFVDRVFLPNFAFKMENNSLVGKLNSKIGLVVCTYGTGAEAEQKVGFVSRKFIQKAVLERCGIKNQILEFYSLDDMDKTTFEHMLLEVPAAINRIIAYYNSLYMQQESLKSLIEKSQKNEVLQKAGKKMPQKNLEDLKYFQQEQRRAKKKARM